MVSLLNYINIVTNVLITAAETGDIFESTNLDVGRSVGLSLKANVTTIHQPFLACGLFHGSTVYLLVIGSLVGAALMNV